MSPAFESTENRLHGFQRRRSRPVLMLWVVLHMPRLHDICGCLMLPSLLEYRNGLSLEGHVDYVGSQTHGRSRSNGLNMFASLGAR